MAVPRTTRVPRPWTEWVIILWSKILGMHGDGEAHAQNLGKWQDGRLLCRLGGPCGLRARILRCLDDPKQQRSAAHTYGPALGQQ